MEGNTALGASSPAKPAFTRPEPLSHTSAVVSSSSHMVSVVSVGAQGTGAEPHGRPPAAGAGGGAGAYLGWLRAARRAEREAPAPRRVTRGRRCRRRAFYHGGRRQRPAPRNAAPAVPIFGRRARRGPGPAVPKEGAPGLGPGEPGPAV